MESESVLVDARPEVDAIPLPYLRVGKGNGELMFNEDRVSV